MLVNTAARYMARALVGKGNPTQSQLKTLIYRLCHLLLWQAILATLSLTLLTILTFGLKSQGVGCGLAGYTDQQIAPLFRNAPSNCKMPEGWRKRFFDEDNQEEL